jgi:mono/diheme cytochrome c family protein
MPAQDFQRMSDQELSDIVAFIRSHPPVNAEVPPPVLGPLGKVLLATGQLPLSVDVIGSHSSAHAVFPPAPAANVEFGGHLAATCSGCHGSSFAGGPIVGGDPSWAPASNLTPDPTGLASWSLDDFITAMREGVRPDGTNLQSPMAEVLPYARNMTEVELEAIWLYLQSLPPVPTAS